LGSIITVNFCLFALFYSVVPGSEELSADEDTILTPPPPVVPEKPPKSSSKVMPRPKLKRPKILHRRRGSKNSASLATGGRDWGERCVEVFEVIVQIGEGTYGQVYKAKDKRSSKKNTVIEDTHVDVCQSMFKFMFKCIELFSTAIFEEFFFFCVD